MYHNYCIFPRPLKLSVKYAEKYILIAVEVCNGYKYARVTSQPPERYEAGFLVPRTWPFSNTVLP